MTEFENLEEDLWSDEPQEVPVEPYNPEDYGSPYNYEEELEPLSEDSTEEPAEDVSFLDKFLMSRGVDPGNVRIQDEQGVVEEVPFNSLSDEEKLAILDTDKYNLSDDEIDVINYFRQNNIGIREYTEYVQKEAVKEYLQQTNSVTNIDDYTDEIIFKADLLNRFKDISDEELDREWETAQGNPTLLEKKISVLREQFKQQEIDNRNAAEQQAAAQKEAQFNTFANSMVEAAQNIDTIMAVEVDNEQKEDILNFCLGRDINGQSQFNKLFEDPEAVFKMAWYMKYGEQALEAVNDYWRKQVGQSRKAQQVTKTVNRTNTRKKEADPFGLDDVFGKA